jgi:hypothetical protein
MGTAFLKVPSFCRPTRRGMKNRYSFTLDAKSTEWYQYHFGDTLLRNDISWRTWRAILQHRLMPDQLASQACAICRTPVSSQRLFLHEYLGGYHLIYCARPCTTPLEESAQRTIEDIEGNAS